jgi:Uma2 family endonuclease
MPPPGTARGKWALRIAAPLLTFADGGNLGDVVVEGGYILRREPDSVRGPDVSFIARQRLEAIGIPASGYFEGAPTLAVEVISPSETDTEVRAKVGEYLTAGAERVWEVRPRLKTVTIHRTGAEPVTKRSGEVLTSDDAAFSVEGFALPLGSIFA